MAAAAKSVSVKEAEDAKKRQRRDAMKSKFSDVAVTIVGIQRAARNTLTSRIQRVQDLRAEGRNKMLAGDYLGAVTALETAWDITWESWLQRNPDEQDKAESPSQRSSTSTATASRRSSLALGSGPGGGPGDVQQSTSLPDAPTELLWRSQQVPPAVASTATEPEANIPVELSLAYGRCQLWESLDRLMGQALQILGGGGARAWHGGVPEGLPEEQELRWVKLMVTRGVACACRGPEHYRRAERSFVAARRCRPKDRAAAMGLQTLRFLQGQADAVAAGDCAPAALEARCGALAALAVAC